MNNQRDIIYEILELLPQDGMPIRAKNLIKEANMSSRSFYKALSYLEIIGAIEKKKVSAIGIEYNISPDFVKIDLERIIYITNRLVLELFVNYDNTEKNQKEEIFDNRLSAIIRFLKLCKTLRNDQIQK